MKRKWASLWDNSTPRAISPAAFYSSLLDVLRHVKVPSTFANSSKEFYSLLLTKRFCIPRLHRWWSPFVPRTFPLKLHWEGVLDSFNDLAWLVMLRAVKVCDSLRNWGYIASSLPAPACSCFHRHTDTAGCVLSKWRTGFSWCGKLVVIFIAAFSYSFFFRWSSQGLMQGVLH